MLTQILKQCGLSHTYQFGGALTLLGGIRSNFSFFFLRPKIKICVFQVT